ncbi:MAG: restriction endonuclease subunit S [Bacteroidales bacterium]|nr:restriction endonuclease subunit S [Bacteroidales bacterium]
MSWEKLKLEEIGLITSGGTPSTGNPAYWNGEIPWITPKDLSNFENRYIENGERNITDEGLKNSSAKLVKEKSVLLSSRAPIGYLAIAQNDLTTNQGFKNITPNEKCDYLYLFYCLKNNVEYLKSLGIGATYPELSSSRLKEIQIPVPSLPTQRKIATILSAYDDLIENNLKRIKLLEEKAQLHYIQYKPIEKIALQDIADYLGRGVTPKYEEGSGFYAINQKANKGSLLEYSQFKSLDSKLEVPDDKFAKWGDLLINSLGEGTLGRVHFYTDKSDLYAVDQHMSIFRTQKQHYTFYLYQFLSSNYGQGLLDSLKKGGTNMTMLNISDLRQLIVSFPSEKELIELWNVCKPLFQLKQTLITQNTKLREARDILLPKLMNGQIEV